MSKKEIKIKVNKKENAVEINGVDEGKEVEQIGDVLSALQNLFQKNVQKDKKEE